MPSSPFLGALAYIRERRVGLSVYLDDPEVSIDTNHLERALRVIPMGRKNWLFSWTELGARHVGILQSLMATCRLHDINPYDYFVDVLQRVGQHPASRWISLRRAFGSRGLPQICCGRTCMSLPEGARMSANNRLRAS